MSDNELVRVFDDVGNLVGVMNRAEAESENQRTENVVMHIFTPDGKLWMQQRALDKKYHPGLWDISAVGGVESHEHRDEAAARETLEEMSIEPVLEYVESIVREIPWSDQLLRRYTHFYVGETDQQPLPNKEVLAFKAWDPILLLEDMELNSHNYIPNIKVLITKGLAYRQTKNPSS